MRLAQSALWSILPTDIQAERQTVSLRRKLQGVNPCKTRASLIKLHKTVRQEKRQTSCLTESQKVYQTKRKTEIQSKTWPGRELEWRSWQTHTGRCNLSVFSYVPDFWLYPTKWMSEGFQDQCDCLDVRKITRASQESILEPTTLCISHTGLLIGNVFLRLMCIWATFSR